MISVAIQSINFPKMTKSPSSCPLSQTLCNLSEVERFEETLGLSWEMNKSLKEALWLCTTTCWVSSNIQRAVFGFYGIVGLPSTSIGFVSPKFSREAAGRKIFRRRRLDGRWKNVYLAMEMWQNDLCPCLCCVWLFCSDLHRQGAARLAKQEAAAFTDTAERRPADLRGIWRPQLPVHQNKVARSHVSDS